jgi:anti-anti-sigma factor
VSVLGELDLATCPRLHEVLDDLAAQQRPAVLDLLGVASMNSTGLNLLIRATPRSGRDGWSFAIRPELSDAVARLFALAGMDGHLPLDDAP